MSLWACQPAAMPTDLPGCEALEDANRAAECRFVLVLPMVDSQSELDAALEQISEVQARDLLLLRLAIARPERASRLCARVETAGAKEKCTQVLGRPHLQTVRRTPVEP